MNSNRFKALKKALYAGLIIALFVSAGLLITACKCKHNYSREITKNATCGSAGEVTYTCSECGDFYTEVLPILSKHNLSCDYLKDSNAHWQKCADCGYLTDKVLHVYNNTVSNEPSTCTQQGQKVMSCICGETHTETLSLAEHDYSIYQHDGNKHWLKCANCDSTTGETSHEFKTLVTSVPSTCTTPGSVTKSCICGETETETLPLLNHGYTKIAYDSNEHWLVCATCNAEKPNQTKTPHEISVVTVDASCEKDGAIITSCANCEYVSNQVILAFGHDLDRTCFSGAATASGHYYECNTCHKNVVEPHTLREFPAKEMTDTEPGNIHYWQCTVCFKYYTEYDCEHELTEDEIFTYPPTSDYTSIKQLIEIAAELPDGIISEYYYRIKAVVEDIDETDNVLMVDDGEPILVTLLAKENVETINENDTITLSGQLLRIDNEVMLVNCEVISVDCGDDEMFSFYFTVTQEENLAYVSAYDDMGGIYLLNTNNYNCLMQGMSLTFEYYAIRYNDAVLQKVIINGEACTVSGGEFTINVNGDVYAEFVFDTDNYCSVTLKDLDTENHNGEQIIADEYVSYAYTNGGYNSDGRLHKNSHLTFTVNNANITGINITYDAEWLQANPDILNNTINAIKSNGVKVSVPQGTASKKGKIVLTFEASDGYISLEYFANICQARVVEITVLYQTNNSF